MYHIKWILGVCALCMICTQQLFAQSSTPPIQTSVGMYARFCSGADATEGKDTKTKIIVSPGKTYDLCVDLLNLSNTQASMHVSFIDGQKDDDGIIGCAEEGKKTIFGQYVNNVQSTYTIPAQGSKRITAKITMPSSAAGTTYGCITVYNDISFKKVQEKGGVSTLVRNANPIEIFVDSKIDVGLEIVSPHGMEGNNFVSDPLFVTKQQNGNYLVTIGFINTGALDQQVEVAGTITDTFSKTLVLSGKTVMVSPQAYGDVSYAIDQLPWYKLWFDVDLTVKHHAVSAFRTEFVTEQLLAVQTVVIHKQFFLFPWRLVGGLVIVLGILQLLLKIYSHRHQKYLELAALRKLKEEQDTH